jgi:hypothetical protein
LLFGGKPPWQNFTMPSKHRYPAITPRPAPELRERAKRAVAEVDSTLNSHVIEFLRWLVGDTDELPARPAKRIQPLPEPSTTGNGPDGAPAPASVSNARIENVRPV